MKADHSAPPGKALISSVYGGKAKAHSIMNALGGTPLKRGTKF